MDAVAHAQRPQHLETDRPLGGGTGINLWHGRPMFV
jgi:hypothetical protein